MTASDLEGRTYLITGANTGIGLATAQALAARGARLVLACRSEQKAAPAIEAIVADTGNPAVELLRLDLADLDSVRAAAATVLECEMPIDVLIDNAGVAGQRGLTAQGFELAFGINHLGHFLFTTLLLDHLRAQAGPDEPARLVVVSSDSHYQAKRVDWEALRKPTKTVTGLPEYEVSKLCNVLFVQELARRVPAEELCAYAVHPGVIASDVWRRVPWPVRPIMTRFMRSTTEGAETSVWTATAPELAGTSGRYYADCAEKAPSEVATAELAAELWRRSEEWTTA